MNRRGFLFSGGAFVGAVIAAPLLSVSSSSLVLITPDTAWDIADRWSVRWSGFLNYEKGLSGLVGNWLAYPVKKNTPDPFRFSFYSQVLVRERNPIVDECYWEGNVCKTKSRRFPVANRVAAGDSYEEIFKQDVGAGLNNLMWMLKRSEELGLKHNIPGGVPIDSMGTINRRQLKLQLRWLTGKEQQETVAA